MTREEGIITCITAPYVWIFALLFGRYVGKLTARYTFKQKGIRLVFVCIGLVLFCLATMHFAVMPVYRFLVSKIAMALTC